MNIVEKNREYIKKYLDILLRFQEIREEMAQKAYLDHERIIIYLHVIDIEKVSYLVKINCPDEVIAKVNCIRDFKGIESILIKIVKKIKSEYFKEKINSILKELNMLITSYSLDN